MNKLKIIFLFLFSNLTFANSPQLPDLLIIEKDTFYIYNLPLKELNKSKKKDFFENLKKYNQGIGIPLNLWRGYIGVWELKNDKLYLIDIKEVENSKKIMETTFPKAFNDGKVLADWFSSYLVLPKDEMLKWDGIFSRTYKKEEILSFRNGKLVKRELVHNYIDLENGISRLERDTITMKLFNSIKELNWTKLSDCECDDDYLITIGKHGIVDKVEFIPYLDTKWQNIWYAISYRKCTRLIRKKLSELQFDIIKWNGKAYEDVYRIKIFYDHETKKLENWTD